MKFDNVMTGSAPKMREASLFKKKKKKKKKKKWSLGNTEKQV